MSAPNRTLGPYELLDCIGRGGMGEVWRARHRTLGKLVAIKQIQAGTLGLSVESDRDVLRRFEREARVAAALRSPHAIQLQDFGVTPDGSFFQVMELLDGLDLRQLVERLGPVPAGRAVVLLRQAADALGEAHALGFVHRDIKPSNLFLCRLGTRGDFLKVLDFGLARSTSPGDPSLTHTGGIPGSPATIAPEVLRGQPPTDKADVYALGCVATWLLTGHLPFEGASAIEVIVGHLERAPAPLVDAAGRPVPPALAACVQSALTKDPASRPTVRELSRALAATGLEAEWSEERAEAWWALHPSTASTPRASATEPLPLSREPVYARLRKDFESSRIQLGEYERRMSVARTAEGPVELLDALRGLPEETAVVPVPAPTPEPTTTVLSAPSSPRIVALLASQVRRGTWRPESRTEVVAVAGSVELDLCRAVLEPGMTELHCTAVFGSVELTVPPGLYVEIGGSGFLGSFEGSSGGLKRAGEPWVRVTGNAVLGSVEVRVRKS